MDQRAVRSGNAELRRVGTQCILKASSSSSSVSSDAKEEGYKKDGAPPPPAASLLTWVSSDPMRSFRLGDAANGYVACTYEEFAMLAMLNGTTQWRSRSSDMERQRKSVIATRLKRKRLHEENKEGEEKEGPSSSAITKE